MSIFKPIMTSGVLALLMVVSSAHANNLNTVRVFYDYLADPSSEENAQAFLTIASKDWESIGVYSGESNSREDVVKRLGGIFKLIPDLVWGVQDMHLDGDTVIVRSRATGTPSDTFFGVDGEGRSFDIMAIDIHTLKEGLLIRTYHVDDWAGAMLQLGGANDH